MIKNYDLSGIARKNKWIIITVLIIVVLGSILHFTYEWSGDNDVVGAFSSVNESVWEHLKLIVFPLLLAVLVQYYFVRQNNLGPGILFGALAGILFIVTAFYTYVGAFTHPKSYLFMDILIFVVAAIIAAIVAGMIFKRDVMHCNNRLLAWIGVVIVVISMIAFTYNPPDLPLFEEFQHE